MGNTSIKAKLSSETEDFLLRNTKFDKSTIKVRFTFVFLHMKMTYESGLVLGFQERMSLRDGTVLVQVHPEEHLLHLHHSALHTQHLVDTLDHPWNMFC